MSSSRRQTFAGFAALAAIGLVIAPAAAAAASGCRPPGAHTVKADHRARVFTLKRGRKTSTFGCLYSRGTPQRLDVRPTFLFESVVRRTVELRPPWVGYAERISGIDTGSSVVLVKDLRSGHTKARANATTSVPGPESFVSVTGLALAGDGSIAWIGRAQSIVNRSTTLIEVDRIDQSGFASLDSGPSIDPHSLSLTGSTISWLDGSELRSAALD